MNCKKVRQPIGNTVFTYNNGFLLTELTMQKACWYSFSYCNVPHKCFFPQWSQYHTRCYGLLSKHGAQHNICCWLESYLRTSTAVHWSTLDCQQLQTYFILLPNKPRISLTCLQLEPGVVGADRIYAVHTNGTITIQLTPHTVEHISIWHLKLFICWWSTVNSSCLVECLLCLTRFPLWRSSLNPLFLRVWILEGLRVR